MLERERKSVPVRKRDPVSERGRPQSGYRIGFRYSQSRQNRLNQTNQNPKETFDFFYNFPNFWDVPHSVHSSHKNNNPIPGGFSSLVALTTFISFSNGNFPIVKVGNVLRTFISYGFVSDIHMAWKRLRMEIGLASLDSKESETKRP